MKMITMFLLLCAGCFGESLRFVQSRPGNYVPGIPLFSVGNGAGLDTMDDRHLLNAGVNPAVVDSMSLAILSEGVGGQWNVSMGFMNSYYYEAKFSGVRSAYQRIPLGDDGGSILKLNQGDSISLVWSPFIDCEWNCASDRSVIPSVPFYTYNTANPVDTIDARLGVYWKDSVTKARDSLFLDCKFEYNQFKHRVGIGYRGTGNSLVPFIPKTQGKGWKVPYGAHWSLSLADGQNVDLRLEATQGGLLLVPPCSQRGVGVLRNDRGDVYRVLLGL